MKSFISYFNWGKLYKSRETIDFKVTKFEDINLKIIPFFEKYKIENVKYRDFENFKKVAELMKNKAHLTPEGLEEIKKIKKWMNRGRIV